MQRLPTPFPTPSRTGLFAAARQLSVRLILSTACLGALAGAGCDQVKEGTVREADRRVAESIGKGETAAAVASDKATKARIAAMSASTDGKTPTEDPAVTDLAESTKRSNESITALTAAANEAGASSESKATAKAKLARVEFGQAMRLIPEVERQQRQLEHVLFEMREVATRASVTAGTRAGYAMHDPVMGTLPTPRTVFNERAIAIKASFDKADAEAKTIQTDLDKRKGEIEAMKQEQAKATQEAEALTEKSTAAKGKESLDLFNQANALRQKAGELGVKMEVATLSLLPVERTLAIAEQQKLAWDNKTPATPEAKGALQRLDEQKKLLDDAWTARQGDIQQVTADLGTMGGELATRATGVTKAAADGKTLHDATALRLTAAAKHFGEAADACNTLTTDLGPRIGDPQSAKLAQLEAWKNMLRLYDEAYFRLQQGSAQLALAELQAQAMRALQTRKRAAEELAALTKNAGITVPAEVFPDAAAKELETARAESNKAFDIAEKTLDLAGTMAGAPGGDLEATQSAAHVMAIESRIGHLGIAEDADKTKLTTTLADDKLWAEKFKVQLPPAIQGKL